MATVIKHIQGNVLRICIPLTLRVVTMNNGVVTETDSDFIPNTDYPVRVIFDKGMKYPFEATMTGNVACVTDAGALPVGVYSVTVLCRNADGEPMRFKQNMVLNIVDTTAEAGIVPGVEFEAETHTLDAAVFLALGGGGTLPDGIVIDPDYVHTDNNFTDEYKEMLGGGTETTTQTYTSDALTYGKCVYPRDLAQDNPSTLGSKWYYGFSQVQRGDVVTLVTDGNNDVIPPLLAFNGDTFVSSIAGNAYDVLDDEITYTVPAGVTQIAVNCWRNNISNFSLEISRTTATGGLPARVSALESEVSTLQTGLGDVQDDVDALEGNIATPSTVTRKVLVIGNSYSYDAFTYLPAVVSEAEPELSTDWVVGICMDGSQTLEGHYTNHAVGGTTFTRYSKMSSAAPYGAWTTDYGATLTAALEDEDWDLIVFHQASNLACDYSSVETPLANLIAWFKAQGYTGKFGWLVVPSFPDGTVQYTKADSTVVTTNKLAAVSQSLGLDHTMTSDEMESRIMDVAHRVQRNNTDISVVLPAGVALQMARKSALNRFGECVTLEGNMPQLMYKDGHHLEMGIANLTESWAIALTLLNGMVAMADIGTPRWPHGDRMSSDGQPVGLDSESQALARQCARKAIDYFWRCDNSESQQSGGSSVTFDDTPTAGSANAVKSGGVYTALAGKQDALTSQTSLGGVNGQTLNYGGSVNLSGEDIPLSSGSSINVKSAIALINNNLAGKQDTLSFGTGLSQSGNEVTVNTASAIASGETGYTTGGQVYSALAGKQDTIAKGSATIAVSDWNSNAVTVTATGVTASNVVIVSPDSASMADYAAAGVQCTAQGANELTFTCTSTPTSSLTINYLAL